MSSEALLSAEWLPTESLFPWLLGSCDFNAMVVYCMPDGKDSVFGHAEPENPEDIEICR
jgi:hypothetical protein